MIEVLLETSKAISDMSSIEFVDLSRLAAFAAWMITAMLVVTGFQRIKEIVAFILLKLYEFFIQKNAMSL